LLLASKCKGHAESVGCELSSVLLRISPVGCKVLLEEEGTSASRVCLGGFERKDRPKRPVLVLFSQSFSLVQESLFPFWHGQSSMDPTSYVVVVLGVFRQWYAVRTSVPWFQTDIPGRKPAGHTENLTPALLGTRSLSSVHKVLTHGLELVVGVPTIKIGGLPPHAKCLGIYICGRCMQPGLRHLIALEPLGFNRLI
jgi:hypothetical protein